jgi:hypothetical protein
LAKTPLKSVKQQIDRQKEDTAHHGNDNIPRHTETDQPQQQRRPNPENDGAPAHTLPNNDGGDLTTPGKHAEPGVDAGLRGRIGDADRVENRGVCEARKG